MLRAEHALIDVPLETDPQVAHPPRNALALCIVHDLQRGPLQRVAELPHVGIVVHVSPSQHRDGASPAGLGGVFVEGDGGYVLDDGGALEEQDGEVVGVGVGGVGGVDFDGAEGYGFGGDGGTDGGRGRGGRGGVGEVVFSDLEDG